MVAQCWTSKWTPKSQGVRGTRSVPKAIKKVSQHRINEHIPSSGEALSSQEMTAFRFMDLPQELRDMVYGYLLCPRLNGRKSWDYAMIRHYGLQPSIMRTCKQVCEEASRTLYTKNSIFVIRMDVKQPWELFKNRCTVARVNGGKIGGVPILAMQVSAKSKPAKSKPATDLPPRVLRARTNRKTVKNVTKEQAVFVGFLPALSKFFDYLYIWTNMSTLEIVVNLERPVGMVSERHEEIRIDCLERLCEGRGFGKATIITDSLNSASAASTSKLMMTRVESVEDILSQATAYETRVSRQLKDEKWNEAGDTLHNALAFIDLHAWRSVPSTDEGRHELLVRTIMMEWKYVSCCLKVGRTGDVKFHFLKKFSYGSQGLAVPTQVADAQCAIGKAYVIDGALNSALYSFLQALLAVPGHAEADQAIEHLKARVRSDPKPEHVMVRLNIDSVLEKVRRQLLTKQDIDDDQKKELLEDFRATYREIERLMNYEGSLSILGPETIHSLSYNDSDERED